MLKQHQQYLGSASVKVRVIVHNVPKPDLQELDTAFIAKFVLATTADEDGTCVVR